MKKKLFPITILCITLAFGACTKERCSSKKQFLDEFELFISNAEKINQSATDEEKLVQEDEYKDMINFCYKKLRGKLTLKERQDFWKQSVIYYLENGRQLSMELIIGSENDEAFNAYIQYELEQVIKDSGNDFERVLQDVIQEKLMPSLNEIFKGIEDLGKNLQEAIDNN